ncbi:hypothetical protein F01_260308 [Burkholderia cenocepacia]|nr:hypothetical protein F01_260308 [Burkholderia cenocepacia]
MGVIRPTRHIRNATLYGDECLVATDKSKALFVDEPKRECRLAGTFSSDNEHGLSAPLKSRRMQCQCSCNIKPLEEQVTHQLDNVQREAIERKVYGDQATAEREDCPALPATDIFDIVTRQPVCRQSEVRTYTSPYEDGFAVRKARR